MEITNLSVWSSASGAGAVVTLNFGSAVPAAIITSEVLARLGSPLTGSASHDAPLPGSSALVHVGPENLGDVTPAPAPTSRTRSRSRAAAPDAATPAADAPSTDAPPAEGRTRRRGTQPAATQEPEKPSISDADLSKACSQAAADIGPEGPEIVMEVLNDFGAKAANDVQPEDREKFLADLREEVRLAKEAVTA